MNSIDAAFDPKPVCHIVTPVGMLGYGFDELELRTALRNFANSAAPTAVILDSGSTDSGPRKLAKGEMTCPASAYVRDLRKLISSVKEFRVPLLISSVGGDGSNEHLKVIEEFVKNLVAEGAQNLKVISITAGVEKDLVRTRLKSGRITGCGSSVPALLEQDIDDATQIVAQMGPQPYYAAMSEHPDYNIILGGRSNDPAPFVAFATTALRKFVPEFDNKELAEILSGGIQHMGKVMECGGLCAIPKSAGAAATVFSDGSFEIVPTNPNSKCTPLSVASHTLYENGRPDIIAGPGGWLDLSESRYEQLGDGRTVRVRGGRFKKSMDNGKHYQVKLEGAKVRGFRHMFMGAIRDPILIGQLDFMLARIKEYVRQQVDNLEEGKWSLDFHVYGRGTPEVFLVGEALAETSELSLSITSTARTATIHGPYPGQKATGGNFAFGHGGIPKIDCGSCAEFCIYHLMDLEPGEEISLFPSTSQIFFGTGPGEAVVKPLPEHPLETNSNSGASRTHPNGVIPPEIQLKDAVLLSDVAKVLRSKNAGPYEITLDVMFDREEVFEIMQQSGILSAEVIASLYNLSPEEVLWCGWYKQALAFKATIPRKVNGIAAPGGGFMESDIHGAQMYMPLFNLTLSETLRQQLAMLA